MNEPKIMRSDDLRVENRHRILHALRRQGSLSRAELGIQTGLSQAALSTLHGLMSDQGIVKSANKNVINQKRGRPKTTVELNPDAAIVVTVALTIDHLYYRAIDYAGETLSHEELRIDTHKLDQGTLFKTIITGVTQNIKPLGADRLKAISIGFEGVTDTTSGTLLWSPILSIKNVPIGNVLEQHFGVPISVNNDCALIANALHRHEHTLLGDNFVAVLFSHGIGLGVYLAGKPFMGAYSSALELGHILFEKDGAACRCGKRGCIEAYVANYGIFRAATDLSPALIPAGQISKQTMDQLIQSANNNGKLEVHAFEQAGKAIGSGLATVFTLLDTMPVVLVGQKSDAIDLMRREIENTLKLAGPSSSHGPDQSVQLHCFPEHEALLLEGLKLVAMSIADRAFADHSEDISLKTSEASTA